MSLDVGYPIELSVHSGFCYFSNCVGQVLAAIVASPVTVKTSHILCWTRLPGVGLFSTPPTNLSLFYCLGWQCW